MKLKSFLLLFAGLSVASQAQDFSDMQWQNELGYEFAIAYPTSSSATSNYMTMFNGIAYKPSYMMPIGDQMSLGLTLPLSIGASGDGGLVNVSYALAGQFSAGLGSTGLSVAPVGAFMALGAGSFDVYPMLYQGVESFRYYGAYMDFGFRIYYYGTPTTFSVGGWWNTNPEIGDYRMTVLRMTYALNY